MEYSKELPGLTRCFNAAAAVCLSLWQEAGTGVARVAERYPVNELTDDNFDDTDFWHKICALIMYKQEIEEVTITLADVAALPKDAIVAHWTDNVLKIYLLEET